MSKKSTLTPKEKFVFFCDHASETNEWLMSKLKLGIRSILRYRSKLKKLSKAKKIVKEEKEEKEEKTYISNLQSLNTDDLQKELLRLYNDIDDLTPKMKIMQHILKIWEQKHKVPTKAKTENKFDFGAMKHGI